MGTSGISDDVKYNSMDITSNNAKIVVGGECKDANFCGTNYPNPFIELIDLATISFTWSLYVASIDSNDFDKVSAIRFRSDDANIVAALDDKNSVIAFVVISTSTGSLVYSIY